nr:hypothetical protein [Tanacetum cinerariifolium]
MSSENKAHFLAEKEAIHLILTGIRDDIYSTVDAYQTTQEMWEAIERLQQGEFLNIQDVKTNLFWEFGKFTSNDGETMESYYTRFYKLMNEMIRNNLTMTTMQVNVQFLQQLQTEWSRYKVKDIAKQITPSSESASEEDIDPEQAQRDKDMQKNLALIAKYFKRIYKHTNNNLRTSSNSRNKNVNTTLWYRNDNQFGQFGNQRTINVARAKENLGNLVVKQSEIQCFNCKEFGHFAKECRKPKKVKDFASHKEKMLLCKQAEKVVPLQAEQYDWLPDMDEEIDEQELEAHYSYMAKIQEVPTVNSGTDSEPLEQVQNDTGYNVSANDLKHSEQSESISNTCIVETDDSNVIADSPDMCDDVIQNDQNDVESDDERVALANLKLDVDENKKIQKELKKATCSGIERNKQTGYEKFKAFNDRTIDYDKLEHQFRAPTAKDIEIPIQTCLMPLALNTQNDSFIFVHELKQEMHADLKTSKKDTVWNEQASNVFKKEREQYIKIQDLKAQLQDKNIAISELKKLIEKGKGKSVETKFDKSSVVRQQNAQQIPKPSVLGKPAPFSDSLERRYFSKTKSVPKTNVSEGLSKPVTVQTLPQTAREASSNINVLKP